MLRNLPEISHAYNQKCSGGQGIISNFDFVAKVRNLDIDESIFSHLQNIILNKMVIKLKTEQNQKTCNTQLCILWNMMVLSLKQLIEAPF